MLTQEQRQSEWVKRLVRLIQFGRERVDAGESADDVGQSLFGMVEYERERFQKDLEMRQSEKVAESVYVEFWMDEDGQKFLCSFDLLQAPDVGQRVSFGTGVPEDVKGKYVVEAISWSFGKMNDVNFQTARAQVKRLDRTSRPTFAGSDHD